MKIFKLSFLMILGISVLSSCAKKTTPPAPAPSSSMSATLNGTGWTANSTSAINNSGTVAVIGLGPSNSTMGIQMPSTTPTGTDSLPSTSGINISYSTGSSSYIMSKGVIAIITNSGGTVSGTFSGTMTDLAGSGSPITVKNGTFTGKY